AVRKLSAQTVNIVAVAEVPGDDVIHDHRVDNRAISGNAEHRIRAELRGCTIIAIEHILFAAAKPGDVHLATETLDHVVLAVDCRRNHDVVDVATMPEPVEEMPEGWLPGQRFQDLSREARRAHPRL